MARLTDAFAQARASRNGRPPLEVGLRTGALVAAIVVCVLAMKRLGPDQMLLLLLPVLAVGAVFTVHTVRSNPRNRADAADEHETCMPILERYGEGRDVGRLLRDYDEWWEGEHSNYTRMHFAEKVVDILRDRGRYDRALEVLYRVAGLPLRGRDHYDFDNYLAKVEPVLKEGLERQRASRGR